MYHYIRNAKSIVRVHETGTAGQLAGSAWSGLLQQDDCRTCGETFIAQAEERKTNIHYIIFPRTKSSCMQGPGFYDY